jgi:hypothetical protein
MINKAMKRKLDDGRAKDVAACDRTPDGAYILPPDFFEEGKDYCDAKAESWIWSIGRDGSTGTVFASTDGRFYQAPGYQCLWLR